MRLLRIQNGATVENSVAFARYRTRGLLGERGYRGKRLIVSDIFQESVEYNKSSLDLSLIRI